MRKKRGKKMSPLLVTLGVDLITRVIDKKKASSATNMTTAAGATIGVTSYATLLQSDDPWLQFAGGLLVVISAGLTLYRSKDNAPSK